MLREVVAGQSIREGKIQRKEYQFLGVIQVQHLGYDAYQSDHAKLMYMTNIKLELKDQKFIVGSYCILARDNCFFDIWTAYFS